MSSTLQITLIKSPIGKTRKHRDIVAGLGLSRLNQTVTRPDSPQVQGMINKVGHMLKVTK